MACHFHKTSFAIFRFIPNYRRFAAEREAQLGQMEDLVIYMSAIDEEASRADHVHVEGKISG